MNKKYDGKLIFTTEDSYGVVEVVDYPDMRCLHFGSPVKQCGYDPDHPGQLPFKYTQLMLLSLLFNPNPQRILYLGLGGGTMATYLWRNLPQCQIDAVERSPAVLSVAYEYFALPKDERLKVYLDDALKFMTNQERKADHYDLIFIDLYLENAMSDVLQETTFFQSCFQQLKTNGVISWNLWGSTPENLLRKCIKSFCISFEKNLIALPTKDRSNQVILGFKHAIPRFKHAEIDQISAELESRMSFSFNLLIAEYQYFKDYTFPSHAEF